MPDYLVTMSAKKCGSRVTKKRFRTKAAADKAYKACKGRAMMWKSYKTKKGHLVKQKGFIR